jgi:hypothetical protein
MPTFETDQPIVLSIEMSQGAVHVIASERTDAVVAVYPRQRDRPEDVEAAGKTVVDLADGTLSIRTPKSHGIAAPLIGWKQGGSIEVTVQLPEGSSLRADAGLVDFRCAGRLGDVEVKTGAGDVRLDRTGALRVRSGAGDVAVEEASDRAEIVAAGEMTIGVVAGGTAAWIDAATKFGRVTNRLASTGDPEPSAETVQVRARTQFGDVLIARSPVPEPARR